MTNFFIRRTLAYLIDGFIVLVVTRLLVSVPRIWYGGLGASVYALLSFGAVLAAALYYILGHWLFGRTIGKAVVRIRVVGLQNNRISLREASLRYLPFFVLAVGTAIVDTQGSSEPDLRAGSSGMWLMAGVSGLWVISEIIVALSKRGTGSIHDLIARTRVIDSRPPNKLPEPTS